MSEPENLMLNHLIAIRAELANLRGQTAEMRTELKGDMSLLRDELHGDMRSLRADVASDMALMRKELGEQISGLRKTVVQYHSSVIGHGVLISELEARMNRVERHLDLPALESH